MQDVLDPIWAYDQKINDFRLFSDEVEWKDHIDVSGAISYLKKHLQKSLSDDFYPAYEASYRAGVGFFALPRIIFPYITFLGTLLSGNDRNESFNSSRYMNIYMARENPTYGDIALCNFIYRVYRHGLSHTNMPKVVSENGKVFGWKITFNDRQHLAVDRTPVVNGKSALLCISPRKLADEVIYSIDEYINDLQDGVASFGNFKKGFISVATTSHYVDWRKTKRIVIPVYLKHDDI
jgi:hypothetical protein